ncbi:helix-turn-helix domain-containing protein [Jeotgalibaca caeni]|uniref:helix-turn-helix domain-containing protein n=1 Tax=Jeotgalibaca caeni TaxID=3028623 RepID=UPI00237E9D1D|nr:helix-turn-helix domain-containing protein [Jeotgalibaca caeni]MDE1549479.1 helix-turn-helix domain-containing protein [Jeotgalibaca caeni]
MATELKIDVAPLIEEYIEEIVERVLKEVRENSVEKKQFLTISEVCEEFNCSRNTLNSWVQNFDLQRIIVGKKIYFEASDLRELFNALKK